MISSTWLHFKGKYHSPMQLILQQPTSVKDFPKAKKKKTNTHLLPTHSALTPVGSDPKNPPGCAVSWESPNLQLRQWQQWLFQYLQLQWYPAFLIHQCIPLVGSLAKPQIPLSFSLGASLLQKGRNLYAQYFIQGIGGGGYRTCK